jgi:hypothetical protein
MKFSFFSAHDIVEIVLILILKYSLLQMTDIEMIYDLTDNCNGINQWCKMRKKENVGFHSFTVSSCLSYILTFMTDLWSTPLLWHICKSSKLSVTLFTIYSKLLVIQHPSIWNSQSLGTDLRKFILFMKLLKNKAAVSTFTCHRVVIPAATSSTICCLPHRAPVCGRQQVPCDCVTVDVSEIFLQSNCMQEDSHAKI